ncbi:MAG: HNH endonuclease [Methylotenera sp.]|nr:MAG: HNH endonuclease [Methylotenera sp.]
MATAKRKAFSSKIRFEVFKRDSFKCQYCGSSAPDVILHVDHIHPVSKGGDNDITNLITSCFDCNMGKKHRLLTDNAVIAKQKVQLDELNEKRLQLELMLKWRKELQAISKKSLSVAVSQWNSMIEGYSLNEFGEGQLNKLVVKFGLNAVLDAMQIAEKYLKKEDGVLTKESCSLAFDKLGGICNLKAQPEWKQQLSYIRGIARNRHSYHNPHVLMKKLEAAYNAGVELDTLKEIALESRHWTMMNQMIDEAVEALQGDF